MYLDSMRIFYWINLSVSMDILLRSNDAEDVFPSRCVIVTARNTGSVPEVLFNIWLDHNAFKLCGELKQCYNMVCTNAYGTKDAHY